MFLLFPVHQLHLLSSAQPSSSSTFSSLEKSATRIVLDLGTSDDDVVIQPAAKCLKVEHVLPAVAAPKMKVLDGCASSSGGSYNDKLDDVVIVGNARASEE